MPLPVYNRNQGNIRRAEINVSQVRTQLSAQEQRASRKFKRRTAEYSLTRAIVARIERELLPDAQRVRDTVYRQFTLGEVDAIAYLNAAEGVQRYRPSVSRYSRSTPPKHAPPEHRGRPAALAMIHPAAQAAGGWLTHLIPARRRLSFDRSHAKPSTYPLCESPRYQAPH